MPLPSSNPPEAGTPKPRDAAVSEQEDSAEDDPYSQAVSSGMYESTGGLIGKYDNVRTLWEDEMTRLALRPHIDRLVAERRNNGRGVRILDLGCGSGDGFALLMSGRSSHPSSRGAWPRCRRRLRRSRVRRAPWPRPPPRSSRSPDEAP